MGILKKVNPTRFQLACPRCLSRPPSESCSLGISFLDNPSQEETCDMASCPWGIASAEHHYCFWNYANDLDVPIPEKDACNLLGITPEQYTETYRSAIAKARLMRNSQVWLDFREAIHEMNKKCEDNTVYVPDKFADFIKELVADPEATEDGLPLPDKPKSKRGRRGKKGKIKRVQLYGLYSQRALKAIHDKKNPKK